MRSAEDGRYIDMMVGIATSRVVEYSHARHMYEELEERKNGIT